METFTISIDHDQKEIFFSRPDGRKFSIDDFNKIYGEIVTASMFGMPVYEAGSGVVLDIDLEKLEAFDDTDWKETPGNTNGKKAGWVYLAECEGRHKIGVTKAKDVMSRIKTISKSVPFAVELVHAFRSNDRYQEEKALHEKFADCRLDGEWFDLTASQVEWIKENHQ